MGNSPCISVIVSAFNVERYISFCVNTILWQTFQDFEIIIVDGSSHDNTFKVCKELYGDNDKVVIVRNENNRGNESARNIGMKRVRGEYVYFINGDDFLLPDTLQTLYTAAKDNNADVVFTSAWFETPAENTGNSIDLQEMRSQNDGSPGFLSANIMQRIFENWINVQSVPSVSMFLCRKNFLYKADITFKNIIEAEEIFSFEIFCLAERCFKINNGIYARRRYEKFTDEDKVSNGINSLIFGIRYLNNIAEKISTIKADPGFHTNVLSSFFYRVSQKYLINFYQSAQLDLNFYNFVNAILSSHFRQDTDFVKHLFHNFYAQVNQINALSLENENLKKMIIFSADDFIRFCSLIDVKQNKIVFINFDGQGYGDNPKYIAEEILRQNLPYDLVWLVNDMNIPIPEKIRKVQYGSVDAIRELSTAKVIVTNQESPLPFIKKKDQFLIMTWHGTWSFKYVNKDMGHRASQQFFDYVKSFADMTDLMLASDEKGFNELRRAHLYEGRILKAGVPRNDIFFRDNTTLIESLRSSLGIPEGNKIIMYAPTFRNESSPDLYEIDYIKLTRTLEEKFGGSWTILLRLHPVLASSGMSKSLAGTSTNVIDVTNYADVQELIVMSDMLITDYSGIFAGFMFLHKMIFLLARDIEAYEQERGLNPLFYKVPYKINRTDDELFDAIKDLNFEKVQTKADKILSERGIYSYDKGHASEAVVDVIKSFVNGDVENSE